ncbi:MAG TPA: hypothetical protein EYP56_02220, partial [Planctomycetaceae bacterium]|nr:hypothetical protein [Planctomycetaceae bacterium]
MLRLRMFPHNEVHAMRIAPVLAVCFVVVWPARGAVIGQPKKAYQDLPTDKPCQHTESVQSSPHEYRIQFRGTVDGTMTRMPIGYGAFEQGWQPNRSVLIENVGTTDVHNPRIVVNGKRKWFCLEEIVSEVVQRYDTPAERARAIWEQQRRRRFHACTWDAECNDAVKVLNVYGYTLCGNEAHVINDLWKAAGLRTRRGYPVGHVVCEVFYDGAFHLMDSDEHVICLKRDNRTIASCADVVRDHDLIKRTHTYGILRPESRKTDEFSASLYSHEGPRRGDFGMSTKHTMELTLRPGESIELRWDHIGKEYSAGQVPGPGQPMRDGLGSLARWGPTAYDNLRNAKLRYRPDLAHSLARRGAEAWDNVRLETASARIRPADPRRPARVRWRFASPWVFVGGGAVARVRLRPGGSAAWRYTATGDSWQTLVEAEKPGAVTLRAGLDDVVSPRGKPTYRFRLELVLQGGAEASDIRFEHDLQTAPLSLPELEVGTNRIVYTDANQGSRQVRITHRWLERTSWHPPAAPARAVFPADKQTVSGTRITFRWSEVDDPDGDRIIDY